MLDEEVSGGKTATVGPRASTSTKSEDLRVLYDDDGQPRLIEGNDQRPDGALSLGPSIRRPGNGARRA